MNRVTQNTEKVSPREQSVAEVQPVRGTEVVVATKTGLNVVQTNPDEMAVAVATFSECVEASVGITGLPDLPRCVLEMGGWRQPDPQGSDTIHTPEVQLNLLASIDVYRYYAVPFGKGSLVAGPSCFSNDRHMGIGTPGGTCKACPLREFREDGRAPDCRAYRLMYGLRQEDNMLIELSLPPASVKPSTDYFKKMRALRSLPYREFTTIGFDITRGYPRATFARGPQLDAEQVQLARAFSVTLRGFLDRLRNGPTQSAEVEVG